MTRKHLVQLLGWDRGLGFDLFVDFIWPMRFRFYIDSWAHIANLRLGILDVDIYW